MAGLTRDDVAKVLVGLDNDLIDYLLPLIADGEWEAVGSSVRSRTDLPAERPTWILGRPVHLEHRARQRRG